MFGQGITGSSKDVPQWIMDVVDEIEKSYNFCLNAVYFKEPTRNLEYYGACYNQTREHLELYFGRDKTDLRLWIVLHELAHAIQHLELSRTLTVRPRGKRQVNHNDAFFDIAGKLFVKYNVLHIALEREYKRGRKYLKAKYG